MDANGAWAVAVQKKLAGRPKDIDPVALYLPRGRYHLHRVPEGPDQVEMPESGVFRRITAQYFITREGSQRAKIRPFLAAGALRGDRARAL